MNTDFFVRPLEVQDEPFLWDMLYQAVFIPEGQPRPDRSMIYEPHLAKYVQGWGRPGDLGWAALKTARGSDEVMAGAAWLRLFAGEQRGYGWVADTIPEISIALLPAYRGMGLGATLLEKTLASARAHFSAVSLSVSKENPAAGLYRRLGFAVVREDENTLVMLRTFSQAGSLATAPGES